jgi:hypothetical protein
VCVSPKRFLLHTGPEQQVQTWAPRKFSSPSRTLADVPIQHNPILKGKRGKSHQSTFSLNACRHYCVTLFPCLHFPLGDGMLPGCLLDLFGCSCPPRLVWLPAKREIFLFLYINRTPVFHSLPKFQSILFIPNSRSLHQTDIPGQLRGP